MSHFSSGGRAALVLSAIPTLALLFSLTGCGGAYYASAPAPVVVASGDYVYYPGTEVYYDSATRVYVYRDRDRWVRRANPPPAFVHNSVSVHVNFHDGPERHHAEVSKTYPRTWKPQPPPRPHDPAHDRDHDNH